MAFQCATAPNMVFATREDLHEHYKSEWHRYNLRRRAAGLAPITKEVFDKVRALAASQEKQSETRTRKQDHVKNKRKGDDGEKPALGRDEENEEDEEETAPEESMESKVRKAMAQFEPNPCRCIWDDHISESVEANLDHMHRHHGFVVHDMEYVKNLTGLINYVAEKVHVGQICLWCEREFRSAAACVAHMTSKGHCRIPWEFEDQVEEYVDYYDFSSLESAEDKTGTMEFDSTTGELILKDADGTTKRLGPSKQFRNVYRALKVENRTNVDSAYANAVKERSIQLYRGSGVLTTSTALTADVKKRLYKRVNAVQDRAERQFHDITVKNGMKVNWLIKDRKAGTNVGAGHGVHG